MRTLVAIPVYNERKYVADVLRRVRSYHSDILCVDDCSTDGTGEFLATQPDIHVVRHAVNQGYGRSIIDAFDFAAQHGYDWVITMDCDEQHEPEMIPAFLAAIEAGDADIISGSRYTDLNANDDLAPGDRRAINMTITSVLNELLGLSLTDSFCGFKAHRVSAMQTLKLDEAGYAFPLQLWPRAYAAGLRIVELPVKRIYNDPNRTFGGNLDDAKRRLAHYMDVLKQELTRIGHEHANCPDHVTLDSPSVCCGCS
ncbi:MAG: glycosyltransferase family 2 protein [Tepidisphaeraceae bacterium]